VVAFFGRFSTTFLPAFLGPKQRNRDFTMVGVVIMRLRFRAFFRLKIERRFWSSLRTLDYGKIHYTVGKALMREATLVE
jgi:hypothetical protein